MLFSEEFKTINAKASAEYRDKGSRFLAFIYPVKTEVEIKELLKDIKKEHPKANHHCYAFRLGPSGNISYSSDDREPSGSAGKPILGVLRSEDITDALIIVVRYFGGTLLGIQGLINAYRSAARNAVDKVKVITLPIVGKYSLEFDYGITGEIMRMLKISNASIISHTEAERHKVEFELTRKESEKFFDLLNKNPSLQKDYVLKSL